MLRYVINPRGRRLQPLPNAEAEKLISRGFKEVTKEEWESKEYFPEHDTGGKTIILPSYFKQEQTTSTRKSEKEDRNILRTRIV